MAAAKKWCFLRFLYFTESSPPSFKVRGLQMTMNLALKKKKKKTQVILSALRPLTCNSTWPHHTLQMFADHYGPRQTIP